MEANGQRNSKKPLVETTNNQNNVGNQEPKKKKRPRQRIRSRNKAFRLLQEAQQETMQNAEMHQTKVEQQIEVNAEQSEEKRIKSSLSNHTQDMSPAAQGKTREEILAEREAKKLAKQAKKVKSTSVKENTTPTSEKLINAPTLSDNQTNIKSEKNLSDNQPQTVNLSAQNTLAAEKTREQIKAEREAKKQAKQAAKSAKFGVGNINTEVGGVNAKSIENVAPLQSTLSQPLVVSASEEKKKPALTKAERRAIQEGQRAAKAQTQKSTNAKKVTTGSNNIAKQPPKSTEIKVNVVTKAEQKPTSPVKQVKFQDCRVKLFNHLERGADDVSLFVNNPLIHPSIARLGEQYAKRTIVGSNARCIAFLNALKMVIKDFETPPKKEFSRSLETFIHNCVEYLHKCRPLAVSVCNAHKHIKHVLTQLSADQPESELKENLCHFIDTYIENQIEKAAQAISSSMQEKITNGDVILTFGCSSLINYICEEAHRRHVDFRVIVVDSRPFLEGQELLRRLAAKQIPCTYVLINAVGFVMPEATKVLLGAHALLSNGYVMARAGTAQVALVARSYNVPVLVCCETHKFSERFQTDAIVYNELGNPDDLIRCEKSCLSNCQVKNNLSPLNLIYDITPPELVTAVVTEVSILPCTSVPVILRIKPTEIGYYS